MQARQLITMITTMTPMMMNSRVLSGFEVGVGAVVVFVFVLGSSAGLTVVLCVVVDCVVVTGADVGVMVVAGVVDGSGVVVGGSVGSRPMTPTSMALAYA